MTAVTFNLQQVFKLLVVFLVLTMTSTILPAVDAITPEEIKTLETQLNGLTGMERTKALLNLAGFYFEKEPQKTIAYSSEGLLSTLPNRNPVHRVIFLNYLCASHSHLSNHKDALKQGKEALRVAKQIKYNPGLADAYFHMGWVYYHTGQYELSLKHTREARQVYKKLGDKYKLASTLSLTAKIHTYSGNYSQALDMCLKADQFSKESGNQRALALTYSTRGSVYFYLKELDNARENYIRSMEINLKIGFQTGLASSYNNLALIHRYKKNYAEALHFYNMALAFKKILGKKSAIANTYNNIGDLYYAQDDYKKSLEYSRKAYRMFVDTNSHISALTSLIHIGRAYRKLKQYPKATLHIHDALQRANKFQSKHEIRFANQELALTYKEMGKFQKALKHYETFKELSDSIIDERKNQKIAEMQTRFDVVEKEKTIQLLNKDKSFQQLALKRQRSMKNFMIIVSMLVFLLVLVIYARFRLKVKATARLKEEMADRKRAEAELLKSMKLESIGILAGGIAHDFNNLLTIITGNVSLVREMSEDPRHSKMLESAESAAEKAADLAQKLITFSKGGWLQCRQEKLKHILNDIAHHYPKMRPFLNGLHLPHDLRPIYGDERQLRQVFHNLIQNAIDAMEDCKIKKFSLCAENTVIFQENQLELKEGEYIKISINDNGIGIPGENMHKVFDPYFSTKNNVTQNGLGLGLAICHSIIKKHKGHIALHSRTGKGTSVEIHLPVNQQDAGHDK